VIEMEQYRRGENTIITVTMKGRLTERELRVFKPHFESEIRHHKGLRLLLQLDRGLSWEPRSNWRNLSFDSRHHVSVSRLAIVAEERAWRQWLVKACGPLNPELILQFHPRRLTSAQQWLFGRGSMSQTE
jgi:hypothetical protein